MDIPARSMPWTRKPWVAAPVDWASSKLDRLLQIAAFALLPAALLWFVLFLQGVRGPYWVAEVDPDYAYLFNALNVARLRTPLHVHHPGTPLQAVEAALLRVTHLCWGNGRLVDDVLANPEFYLRAVSHALLGCYVLTLFLVGLVAYRLTGNWLVALLMQAAPWFSVQCLDFAPRVSPEILNMLMTQCTCLALLAYLERGCPESTKFLWIFAGLAGINIATKLTALPLGLMPLFLIPTWRSRFRYCLFALAAFVLVTLPALPRYKFLFFEWIFNLATHTGMYGHGSAGLVDSDSFLSFLLLLARTKFLFLLTVIGGAGLGFYLVRRSDLTPGKRNVALGLLAVTTAQALQILLVAKHPAVRYLVPSLALLGFDFVLLFRLAGDRPRVTCGLAALLVLWFLCWQGPAIADRVAKLDRHRADRIALVDEIRKRNITTPLIHGPGGFAPDHALYFGNVWCGLHYAEPLTQRYPSDLFCHHRYFADFRGPVTPEKVITPGQTYHLLGCTRFPPRPTGLQVDEVFRCGDQVLYRVTREPGADTVTLEF